MARYMWSTSIGSGDRHRLELVSNIVGMRIPARPCLDPVSVLLKELGYSRIWMKLILGFFSKLIGQVDLEAKDWTVWLY